MMQIRRSNATLLQPSTPEVPMQQIPFMQSEGRGSTPIPPSEHNSDPGCVGTGKVDPIVLLVAIVSFLTQFVFR